MSASQYGVPRNSMKARPATREFHRGELVISGAEVSFEIQNGILDSASEEEWKSYTQRLLQEQETLAQAAESDALWEAVLNEIEDGPKDDISAVMHEEINRFGAMPLFSVGGIPAMYADRMTHIRCPWFMREVIDEFDRD